MGEDELVEVEVAEGRLQGRRCTRGGGFQYDAFIAVPYAKPPLGDLRFRAPRPPEAWHGVREARDSCPHCLQADSLSGLVSGSEDCLYLNVFTPSVREEDKPLPVMVWTPPGAFRTGKADRYRVEHLCRRGVVMVAVSYRLGALGFLSLHSAALQGNAGLKDCVAALRWLQRNVSAFGGDPGRVTVFGTSSGGKVAQLLQLAPSARGLFHRAVSQSGSALNPAAVLVAGGSEARARAFRLAQVLGLHDPARDEHDKHARDEHDKHARDEHDKHARDEHDKHARDEHDKHARDEHDKHARDEHEPARDEHEREQRILRFLRGLPARRLLDATDSLAVFSEDQSDVMTPFFPVPEVEGEEEVFLPDSPRNLLYSNRFYPVPWIAGFAEYEGCMANAPMFPVSSYSCMGSDLDVAERRLDRFVPPEISLSEAARADFARDIRQLYFGGGSVTKPQYFNLATDLLIGHGVHESARRHAAHPAAPPAYLYYFTLRSRFNNSHTVLSEEPPGASHCDEIHYLLDSSFRGPFPPGSAEAHISDLMAEMWTNFAKTGDPNPASGELQWEPLPPNTRGSAHYLQLGSRVLFQRGDLLSERMAFWDALYASHYQTPSRVTTVPSAKTAVNCKE